MNSHIGCTFVIFLRSEFLNVPSHEMHGQRNSHIGCTCAVFLLSDFSNAPSDLMSRQRHSHIGCNGVIFSWVTFKVCSQFACASGCIWLPFLFSCLSFYCSEFLREKYPFQRLIVHWLFLFPLLSVIWDEFYFYFLHNDFMKVMLMIFIWCDCMNVCLHHHDPHRHDHHQHH